MLLSSLSKSPIATTSFAVRYLKADGMPAQYSPDFLLRTADEVYVVETKAQSALSDENVKRKQRAAVAWVEQINALDPSQRDDREWHYVLLGQTIVEDWRSKSARASELLEYAQLRRLAHGQAALTCSGELKGLMRESRPATVVSQVPRATVTGRFLRSCTDTIVRKGATSERAESLRSRDSEQHR